MLSACAGPLRSSSAVVFACAALSSRLPSIAAISTSAKAQKQASELFRAGRQQASLCLPAHLPRSGAAPPYAASLHHPWPALPTSLLQDAGAGPKRKSVGRKDPEDSFIFKSQCKGKRKMSEEAKELAEMCAYQWPKAGPSRAGRDVQAG